jgi:2-octaprenyl-3-methyl-6-methoxy-1,4-benzoquinol hydroxylase
MPRPHPISLRVVSALAAAVLVSAGVHASELANLAEDGRFAELRSSLSAGADPDEKQPDGSTALLWASYHGEADAVRALLAAGADPNTTNRLGMTALAEAAGHGAGEIVALLLEAGADADAELLEGDTPLMLAARSGTLAGVEALLAHGADVNAIERFHGETALMWAAGENHADVVARLIDAGADLEAVSFAFEWKGLKQAGVSSYLPRGGLTALLHAARQNAVEAARVLVEQEADEVRAATEFNSDEIGCSELGHIVENRVVQLALLERVRSFANIDLICPARTEHIEYAPGSSLVRLADGREVLGRLLVAADGGQSRVRQAAGIGVTQWDYDQHALVASVQTGYGQQDITWQQFTPTGPLAFLPLGGNHASLVWYGKPDTLKALMALDDAAFLQQVERTFPASLGQIDKLFARGSFPLRRQHAQRYVGEGVALVGDAAHMIHPLAGQGVNIGLLDAAALAEVIVQAQSCGEPFGAVQVLARYEDARRQHNLMMMQLMDSFYRVFSNRNLPLKLLRNLWLGLAERLAPAKRKVIRMAMGLEGDLPALARGEAIIRDS